MIDYRVLLAWNLLVYYNSIEIKKRKLHEKDSAKARLERELDSYRGDESLDSVLRLLSENAKDSPKEKVIGRESK